MNFKEIKETGFSFDKVNIDREIYDFIIKQNFHKDISKYPSLEQTSGEYKIEIDNPITHLLRSELLQKCEDEITFNAVINMGFIASLFKPNDFIALHKDNQELEIEDSFFHLNIWLPVEEFQGRKFLYGKIGHINKYIPSYGDCVCIGHIDDSPYWHGVSKMISGAPFLTINGYKLGETNDFSKLNMECEYYANKIKK